MSFPPDKFPYKYPWAKPYLDESDRVAVAEAMESEWISDGEFIGRFESAFAHAVQAEHALTCSSGTGALMLAMLALGIGRGDEVIVPGYGFAGAANMVLAVGAKPVFVDVTAGDWCLDPAQIELFVTPQTKALVVIHNYGSVALMDQILSVCNRYNLKVIEDCAEAVFSEYQGLFAGCIGDIGCYSFQAAKTLSTGEGGMVVTQDEGLYERMQLLRNHGMSPGRRYFHEVAGHNLRMTNIQAALGWAQLQKKEFFCRRRRMIAEYYRDFFRKNSELTFQEIKPSEHPVYWTNAVRVNESAEHTAAELISALAGAGIETRPGFVTFDQMPPYQAHPLPVARDLAERVLCLPTYPALEKNDLHDICRVVKRFAVKEKSFF